ncbi:hypothetical protein [Crateriforma spongiae]|uniref:hypothetical protein n=1 Tax=Crateriforma spongiae TaxID=2724528 RepID=UPI0039AF109F
MDASLTTFPRPRSVNASVTRFDFDYWNSTIRICFMLLADTFIADPDGNMAALPDPWHFPDLMIEWMIPITVFLLFASSFVAYRRSNLLHHLLLLTGAVMVCLGFVGFFVADFPLRGATIAEMRSGSAAPIVWLQNASSVLLLAGLLFSSSGAAVSIFTGRAVRNQSKHG